MQSIQLFACYFNSALLLIENASLIENMLTVLVTSHLWTLVVSYSSTDSSNSNVQVEKKHL